MVRNMRAVLKKASCGTRRIFRGTRCSKQASTVRKRYSVPKTGFSGTRRIFRGPQNSRLHRLCTASWGTRRVFRGVPCHKQPPAAPDASSVRETAPLSLFAPATPSLAPSTALGTRNGPRSEVSRHKKETKVKDFDLFCRGTVTRTQDPLVPNQMR